MGLPVGMLRDVAASAVALRHRLHQVPELGFAEHKTARIIRDELTRLGVSFVDSIDTAATATIATIGDTSRPCVALRADIDALPIEEMTGLPYTSTHPGRMHACGHDGHTAVLLGAAAVLQQVRDELDVCVKLIFQPAEEGGGGGQRLVQAGVLCDGRLGPKVEAIFALHGWPGLKVGTVATKAGPLLAATDSFTATFVGRACHGAFPHLGVDPITTACSAVLALQQVVSREFDPTEPVVVTVGQISAGTATNIIPRQASIAGTARTLTPAARAQVASAIERRCRANADAGRCQLDFAFNPGYPPTINNPQMADYIASVARQTLGEQRFVPVARASMGGEDFAYYLEQVPGCFFLLGVEPLTADQYPSLHSDLYDFTDDAVAVGIEMMVATTRLFARRSG